MQCNRHITNLIEEQRATICEFDLAERLLVRARKRAFLVTEQLGFEQVLRNGCTVDRNEIVVCTRTQAMQRACKQFLPGTALAEQQGCDISRRYLLDHATDGEHAFGCGDDAIER